MKFLASLREYFSVAQLQKLQVNSWAIPSAERILPYYLMVLSGFILATALGFVVAYTAMPKVGVQSKAADRGNTEEIRAVLVLPEKPREADFAVITKRNIFDSTGGIDDGAPKTQCELVKSALPLRFTGVIYGGSAQTSLVLLESTATKEADGLVLGDLVADARIVDIERNRVIFERNNCREYIDLEEPAALKRRVAGAKPVRGQRATTAGGTEGSFREDGFERDGGTVKATRQWVEKALTVDFAKTLQDMKASPNMVNGEVKGFVLSRIRPDSVYEKMGLVDGDVVEAINGVELNDAARAIGTLNNLRNEQNIELTLKRNGQVMNMKVQVR